MGDIAQLETNGGDMSIYEESGFSFPEELETALDVASAGLRETTGKLKVVESTLQEKKDLQTILDGNYFLDQFA